MLARIVCGTDFTEQARRAAGAAAALASALRVPLELIHVLEAEDASPAVAGRARGLLDEQVQQLQQAWPETAIGAGVARGFVEEVLAGRAQDGLAVVGAHGRRPPWRWLLGSSAERLAQVARGATLIVRDGAPFERWARGGGPLRVVAGVDFTRTARASAAWLGELRRRAPLQLKLVHVASPGWQAIRLGQHDAPYDHLNEEAEQVVRRELAEWLGELVVDAQVEIAAGPDPVEAQLVAAAADADLLVVGTHQRASAPRLWYGSVSRAAIALAGTNVAVVPTSAVRVVDPPPRPPRRILVPMDFSEAGARAAALAYALAPDGSAIHLVHVLRALDAPGAGEEALSERLARCAPATARERAVTTSVEVVPAHDVAGGIWHAAERFGAELVCLASPHRGAFAGPGATARAVVARCACPVLLVP